MTLSDIKSLSYNYKTNKMEVELFIPKVVNGYMTSKVAYSCNEEVFREKVKKWLDFKYNLSNV